MPTATDKPLGKPLNVDVFGHASAQPAAVAVKFEARYPAEPDPSCDLAIFAINPAAGIDAATILSWEKLSEFQIPRIVVVTSLEGSEADFDDAVLVANRVFDQLVTPYLVLHSDAGAPVALISLESQKITDFTTNPPAILQSDPEHQEIISSFRDEYLELIEASGVLAFEAGLLFPAIPLILEKNLGVEIVQSYIQKISESPSVR